MEFKFDPYGLTELPPPSSNWKRASAFIAGMIANRMTFYLAKIGAWLPGTKSNEEIDPLQQLLEMKYEVERLRPLFEKYSRAAGFKSDGLKWFDAIYVSSTEAMEGLSRDPNSEDHFEWQYGAMEITKSEDQLDSHIKDKIEEAEIWLKSTEWLRVPFTKTKKANHSYFFQIGFAFDYLIKTYSFSAGNPSVDQSFKIVRVGRKWELRSSGQKCIGGFGLPSILAKGLLEKAVEFGIGPKVKTILEYYHSNKQNILLNYYSAVSDIWCSICLKDCENLKVKDRVLFGKKSLSVDGFYYYFDRNMRINEAIIYSFVKKGACSPGSLIMGNKIKNVISKCIPEFAEINADRIDPKDRLNKCKAPWAKHFWYEGLCGNPKKRIGEVGYYLNMHTPKSVLYIP